MSEDHQAIGSKNPHIQAQHPDSCTLDLIMALDWVGRYWAGLDCTGWDSIDMRCIDSDSDWIDSNWIGLERIDLDWIGLDRLALTWCGLDWIGSGWIGCLAGNRLEQKNINVSLFRPVADIDFNTCVLFWTRVWQPIQFCWEASLSCEQMLLHGYGKSACTQHCYHYCLIQIR